MISRVTTKSGTSRSLVRLYIRLYNGFPEPFKTTFTVKLSKMLSVNILTALLAAPGVLGATSWIVPGTAWYDTAGNKIDAHGGGIVQRGNTFYWLGQSVNNGRSCIC